jgi:AAA15 family ATPase/GTPase
MRRDQIYFIDKDNDTAVSELYSLDEYSVRTREDVRKSYLNGKFGAVPNIG